MVQQDLTTSTTDKNFQTEHLKVNLGGRTARGGAVAITSQGLKFMVTLAASSVMARLLTPQDYGLIGMVAVVTGFVSMYKDIGLAAATIQKPEITSEQVSNLFWVNVCLSVGVGLVTIALAPIIAWFYGEPRLLWITIVTSLGFLIGGLAVQHEALLRRQMRYVALATVGLTSVVMGYVVGIVMAWRGFAYWALVGSQLAVVSTGTLMTLLFCRWLPGLPKRDTGVRSMIRFGGNLTGFTTINYFARNFDNLLIGRFSGALQLGLYSRAYQLMSLPIDQINEPITSVSVPALSRLLDSPESYRRAYLRMLEKIAMLTMPGVVLMIVTSDWIIHIFLGKQWVGAVQIFVILGVSAIFQPIANTTGWLLISQGRTNQMLKWGMISGPMIVTSFLIGLPWGAVGVATAYACVKILINDPLLYWYVGREGPVKTIDFYKTMAPFAIASICSLIAGILFRRWTQIDSGILTILSCAIITGLTTLLILAVIPAGRAALYDLKHSSLLVFNKGKRASAT